MSVTATTFHFLTVHGQCEARHRQKFVHPHTVNTIFICNSPENLENMAKSVPLQRLAKPDEVAHLVMFLVAPGSEYITGSEFTIDGGQTI